MIYTDGNTWYGVGLMDFLSNGDVPIKAKLYRVTLIRKSPSFQMTIIPVRKGAVIQQRYQAYTGNPRQDQTSSHIYVRRFE